MWKISFGAPKMFDFLSNEDVYELPCTSIDSISITSKLLVFFYGFDGLAVICLLLIRIFSTIKLICIMIYIEMQGKA